MKKSLSSQITEQSGDATKVAEGWEAARDAGLDRRSNTFWKCYWLVYQDTNVNEHEIELCLFVREGQILLLTPSLHRCSTLLDDEHVNRVDLGWVTVGNRHQSKKVKSDREM